MVTGVTQTNEIVEMVGIYIVSVLIGDKLKFPEWHDMMNTYVTIPTSYAKYPVSKYGFFSLFCPALPPVIHLSALPSWMKRAEEFGKWVRIVLLFGARASLRLLFGQAVTGNNLWVYLSKFIKASLVAKGILFLSAWENYLGSATV